MVFVEIYWERGVYIYETKYLGIPYMNITQDMESENTQTAISEYLNQYRDPKKVFIYISSSCISELSLRYFKKNNELISVDFDWNQIFPDMGFYLKLGNYNLFEFLWRNEIWNPFSTKETFRKTGYLFDVQTHLCATGFRTTSGKIIDKNLGFTSNFRPFVMIMNQNFGQYKYVDKHIVMNEINWSEITKYNIILTRGIFKVVMKVLEAT